MELDVSMYLESIITHRLRGTAKLEELLPDRWRANHPEAVREYPEQERRDKGDVATRPASGGLFTTHSCYDELSAKGIGGKT
jgi:hypothetical protein